jgi:hypothetical protein
MVILNCTDPPSTTPALDGAALSVKLYGVVPETPELLVMVIDTEAGSDDSPCIFVAVRSITAVPVSLKVI